MGRPAPAPQPTATATPADSPAVVSIDTGHPLDEVADAHVNVLDNDSVVEAKVDVLGGTFDCNDGDSYGADSSAAISLHAQIPSDLGGLSVGDLGPDLGDLGSALPVGDCLLGDAPDLCSALGDIV